jgi:ubiquinone/menaquinone biosynthesis C-methylase UbiE
METSRQSVIGREKSFHNKRFEQEQDPRSHLDKWYWAIRHGAGEQDRQIKALFHGADVLEYGCSDGGWSLHTLRLHEACGSLTGIDISDVAISKATAHAEKIGASNARFFAMNAEEMTFPDDSFDFVYGRGIVHHLDLHRCFHEIARVLRSGGSASFFEPMGHNPALNAYRRGTPDIRTVDEHPLLVRDFERARLYFNRVDIAYFGLFSIASAVMPTAARKYVYVAGKGIDSLFLKLPYVGRFAWYALITLAGKTPHAG